MRILVLSTSPRQPDNHLLWEGLSKFADVEIHYFSKQEQKRIGALLRKFDFSAYDRVVCDLLFRYLVREWRLLSRIRGLLIYEEDACQEFIESSKWKGSFTKFYRKVPHARIVITGFRVCQRYRESGIDAHFLPKGFDSSKLYDMGLERDIPLGFVGRLDSETYQARKEFLLWAERRHGLRILRAAPGDDYRNLLNRIRVFVSADIGLGEYMAKNFEAMACGCALLAFRQGHGEEEALGIKSGEQVMLYENQQQFELLVAQLSSDQNLVSALSSKGKAMAIQRFDYAAQSAEFFAILAAFEPVPRVFRTRQWLRRLGLGGGRGN
ncbi:glycosyltransferase family protein [Stutzerimonas chloritidismutans]|uniref:glycosyltransferase family protein n=1 Tax=Stutzerimonas chloritidismutans TaxID=203192 RepID=UPI001D1854FB|nr:glycosyltransferase [Stutzerimonas chloritidismutans]UEG61989.1 glycosyltransferase [Stutzerimonas chloritidismutans]